MTTTPIATPTIWRVIEYSVSVLVTAYNVTRPQIKMSTTRTSKMMLAGIENERFSPEPAKLADAVRAWTLGDFPNESCGMPVSALLGRGPGNVLGGQAKGGGEHRAHGGGGAQGAGSAFLDAADAYVFGRLPSEP